jgi:hypothetical protein
VVRREAQKEEEEQLLELPDDAMGSSSYLTR